MAWTVTESVQMNRRARDGIKKKSIKLECTSDGSGTSHAIESGGLRGLFLYGVKYIPSGAPDAPGTAPTITITDALGATLFNEAPTAAATAQWLGGDLTIGQMPLVDDALTIALTTLDDTKKADFIFQFVER